MGWLFKSGYTRKDLIEERTRDWERPTDTGMLVKSKCIAHCYRGGVHSGALWSVWERTFEKDGKEAQPTERWIACDLLRCQGGAWGYKDLDEAMGPYYFSCPLGYLDLVPIEQFGGNAEWREGVKAHHTRAAEKRKQTPARRK